MSDDREAEKIALLYIVLQDVREKIENLRSVREKEKEIENRIIEYARKFKMTVDMDNLIIVDYGDLKICLNRKPKPIKTLL
jgi:hypothetical protein